MNPIDWIAWIYGKVFLNHPIFGGFVFCLLASLIMLVLYVRAIDKYRDDHPAAPLPPSVGLPKEPEDSSKPPSQEPPQTGPPLHVRGAGGVTPPPKSGLQVRGTGTVTPAITPEPEVQIAEQKEVSSLRPTEKHALRVTIEATKTIQPVHLRIECDRPPHAVDLEEPVRLGQFSYGVVPNEPNVAEVTFQFPPIDKNRPVVVVLYSNEPLKVKSVRNIQ